MRFLISGSISETKTEYKIKFDNFLVDSQENLILCKKKNRTNGQGLKALAPHISKKKRSKC